ncbi:MAG: hypothetical protein KC708_23850, partial [Anaerolineae bacterium]|nr:hypothetical protein [Anaerolineae bacterium]
GYNVPAKMWAKAGSLSHARLGSRIRVNKIVTVKILKLILVLTRIFIYESLNYPMRMAIVGTLAGTRRAD